MINVRRGFARLGRRAAALALVDLAIIALVASHLAGGTATGASPTLGSGGDPFRLLGTTLVTSCPKVPLSVGKGTFVVCPEWTAVLSTKGVVEVVSIYGPGSTVVDAYPGSLPAGLRWGDKVSAAWKNLGRPNRITNVYGTPTLVYFFDHQPYGSLELRFDTGQHLKRINAELVH